MKNPIVLLAGIIGIVAILYFTLSGSTEDTSNNLFTDAQQGKFLIEISATGELKAKKSIKIRGPQGMRSAGVWQTTIKDLVPEGTKVKKGQFVASLDKNRPSY